MKTIIFTLKEYHFSKKRMLFTKGDDICITIKFSNKKIVLDAIRHIKNKNRDIVFLKDLVNYLQYHGYITLINTKGLFGEEYLINNYTLTKLFEFKRYGIFEMVNDIQTC